MGKLFNGLYRSKSKSNLNNVNNADENSHLVEKSKDQLTIEALVNAGFANASKYPEYFGNDTSTSSNNITDKKNSPKKK